MAKKIRFPLILSEMQVRTPEELRRHFNLEQILEYYDNGKLVTWLEDRYMEGEAAKVRMLKQQEADFQRQLCQILGAEYPGIDVDVEKIKKRRERRERLRKYTDEKEYLEKIDVVAFDQEELADLLDEERQMIYLCEGDFIVPASCKGIVYIGIGMPKVKISGNIPMKAEEWGIEFKGCDVEKPEKREAAAQKIAESRRQLIAVGNKFSVGVRTDGTVVCSGNKYRGYVKNISLNEDKIKKWKDIKAVSAGDDYVIGLKFDGSIVVEGKNSHNNRIFEERRDFEEWKDIQSIYIDGDDIFGIISDRTVKTERAAYNVGKWKDIVSICSESSIVKNIVGLKSDGSIVVSTERSYHLQGWSNIQEICAGNAYIVGLKTDGTVLIAIDEYQRRYSYSIKSEKVEQWRDIISICSGTNHLIGLKKDGTVVAEGQNKQGQCDVNDWTNIAFIYAKKDYTVGIRSDRTVVSTVSSWNLKSWTDIIAVYLGNYHMIGLKSDGTVVSAGSNTYGQCDVYQWKLF